MDIHYVFVETVEDLRRRCDLRASEYDMVQARPIRRLRWMALPYVHR